MALSAVGGCTPAPVERRDNTPPPTPPAAAKAVDPSPQISQAEAIAAANGAQERAVQLYPDLAVKGSLFNRTFLEVLADTKARNPDLLTHIEWPVALARRTAGLLGVSVKTPPPDPVEVPSKPVTPASKLIGTSLDKKPGR